MTTILAGQPANFTVTVQTDGVPVAFDPTSTVKAQVFSADGSTSLGDPVTLSPSAAGANWAAGILAVSLDANATNFPVGSVMLVVTSTLPSLVKRFRLNVETAASPTHSALFIKDFAVDELRQDRLMVLAGNFLSGFTPSDDYLWGKIVAAESAIAHELRVPLVPTMFFPYPPTPDQIAGLPAGMPYAVDPPYDYGPTDLDGDKWGYTITRQKPVQSVVQMRFAYPDPAKQIFVIPPDWVRLDQKYGHIRLVPTTYAVSVPLSAFILQSIAAGREIPFMLEIQYIAGLENAAQDYPELLDAIKKLAVLKAIEDSFPAQSGSISADGLSQSISVDLDKYHGIIDTILNGAPGTNGGLMTAIHGIRSNVLGG